MVNFYIETYGCSANKSDSEIISGLLRSAGMEKTENIEIAELVIINTCIVKEPTESKVMRKIKDISEKYPEKKILISGCMPEAYPEKLREKFPGANLISTNRVPEILKIIEKIFSGKRLELLGKPEKEKLGLPRINESKVIDIVQICTGCLGNCSYCATKIAKGNLRSYPKEKIVSEINEAKKQGIKEFWLTGQDISCYGFEIGTSLPELVSEITSKVDGNYKIRLGMMNPTHLKKIIEPLLESCEDERVFRFFHIPVQSGSDKVLKDMNRNYCVKDFEMIVKNIRTKFHEATIGTDIIVGYPTESEVDFRKTIKLIEEVRPDWTHISKFWPRKKTEAEKLKLLNLPTVRERSIRIRELANKISGENMQRWMGWAGEVLVDEFGKTRNPSYQEIKLNTKDIGKFVKVKVYKVEGVKIFGKTVA